ncbi:MAG: triose-phosphate isomerase [Desulfovibrionales bacterium]
MKKLMAANWKMHMTRAEASQTVKELVKQVGELPDDREVLICPPFTSLASVASALEGKRGYSLGGQNFYPEEKGAFTGEIAPEMLKETGCTFALAGHSERRHVMGEEDEFVSRKVSFGLDHGLGIILCIGETLDERKRDQVEDVLSRQLEIGLKDVSRQIDTDSLAVAYEPVWAIGTGEVAGENEIADAHAFIRDQLASLFPDRANAIRILYGGSVKPGNCASIIGLDNVDGVLVGGASLKAESFSKIILAGV